MKNSVLLACATCAASLFASDLGHRPENYKYVAARRMAANGIVLLENKDNALPLKAGETVVLAGVTSYYNIRMGWGSGDMMKHTPVQYDKGLENAGVSVDAGFAKVYRDFIDDPVRRTNVYERINLDWDKWTRRFDEPEISEVKFAELAKDKRQQKCLVTIGRGAGESEDLKDAPGSFRLHPQEDKLLKLACANFDTVIVLLNGPGVMDVSFMDKYPIKALVFTSYLGEVSGDAVADVLTGKVNPSGKTVDTWMKRYHYYPTTDCFGALDIPYHELYCNYRNFDGSDAIRYPFGYGLSYTTFSLVCDTFMQEGVNVAARIAVSNTGKRVGSEIVQLYLVAPEADADSGSTLPLPKRLCAFARVDNVKPGLTVKANLSFNLTDFAAYDEATASWVLDAGEYQVLCGDSSEKLERIGRFKISKRRVVQQVKNRFNGKDNAISRKPLVKKTEGFVKLGDVLAKKATLEDLVAQFTDEELVAMINGRVLDGQGYAVEGGTGVGGSKKGAVDCEAGEFWSSEKYGIPAVTCADGPSGVRLGNFNDPVDTYNPDCGKMFAWPCATALAQGWDVFAAEVFGRMIAEDMQASGIDCWLAPGVNVHRNPLCGRNFEYFSEDTYLSGMMGAAVVRGVQRRGDGNPSGCMATVKHFCANNQEFYRGEANVLIEERELREIYLKPFELAVKYGRPLAIMSSYNKVNDDYCATTYDIMTGVLREEWGFDGLVMTDWWNAADKTRHPAAGNDVVMPGVRGDYNAMLAALKDGRLKRADAQHAAVNVLKAAVFKLSR